MSFTLGTGEDVELAWSVSANRPLDVPVTAALEPEIDRTVAEILTTADELKGTFAFEGATSPRTLTNAQITIALGGETDFKLRAWFERAGLRSLNYDQITVRKV